MKEKEAYQKLVSHGIHPSVQRLAILDYLLTHYTHPTVEDVHGALCRKIPTLSRTTVYNTLRLFSEAGVAQMVTIDDHHICYDGVVEPHVHFYCRKCGKVMDLMEEKMPDVKTGSIVEGNRIDETQLYYKGVCSNCMKKSTK